MYQPSHFQVTNPVALRALINDHPLALLIVNTTDGKLEANPLPLHLRPPSM